MILRPVGVPEVAATPLHDLMRRIFEDAFLARLLAWILPGRVIPLVTSYALATGALLFIHQCWLAGLELDLGGGLIGLILKVGIFTLGLPAVALVGLALLVNARELMMMALSRKGKIELTGRVPLVDARFYPMSLRGRRAFAVHATFRTDKLSPSSRVGLEVRLFDERGKQLPGNLPRYRAPDGEFLGRELSQPIGQADDFQHTIGTLMPITAIGIPRVPDVDVRLKAEITLTYEGHVQATQNLITEVRTRPADFPEPPKRRDAAPVEEATEEEVAFVGGTLASGGNCPVCGDGLDGQVLACDGCHVPHHGECWRFAGRCSTYGCEGNATEVVTLVAETSEALASEVDAGAG